MLKWIIIATVVFLGGCAAQVSAPVETDDASLKSYYTDAVVCIRDTILSNNDTPPPNDVLRREINIALDFCDQTIERYADAIAERALIDNGWGRYTQNVPLDVKLGIRSNLQSSFLNYYSE